MKLGKEVIKENTQQENTTRRRNERRKIHVCVEHIEEQMLRRNPYIIRDLDSWNRSRRGHISHFI